MTQRDPSDMRLSTAMMDALGEMPIRLTEDHFLPPCAPSSNTIQALHRRGLVGCDGFSWSRTALGHAAWEAR